MIHLARGFSLCGLKFKDSSRTNPPFWNSYSKFTLLRSFKSDLTESAPRESLPLWEQLQDIPQKSKEQGPSPHGYIAALIIPTGIGASIGGYAGDGIPVAKAIASVVDTLITHPNVMNGAQMYWPQENILYVEGYALDEVAKGNWGLQPVTKGGNRIGLVLDAAMEQEMRLRHIQAANAARATLGIDVAEYIITEEPIGVQLAMSPGGASWGTVSNPNTLLKACETLVNEGGCNALALVARFPDDEDEEMLKAYREGEGVDAIGGSEAILSHLVVQHLQADGSPVQHLAPMSLSLGDSVFPNPQIPCAHAPGLPPLEADETVHPRACAEELGYTFLPCVLANLHRAPHILSEKSKEDPRSSFGIWARDIDAIVVPESACGGSAVLSLANTGTLIIAVEDNKTTMQVQPKHLEMNNCITVRSYFEAIGVLVAHKVGVNGRTLTIVDNQIKHHQ